MSTQIAKPSLDPTVMELVVAHGDLSRLTPEQRIVWYRYRCEAAGLDPRTQPFQYLSLQNKLTLYATKAATDQLISSQRLQIHLHGRVVDRDTGVAEQVCTVTRSDGTAVDDLALVTIKGLQGDALCNALMKLATKAKRRTVLSACGLGVTDESEIDTIPGAQRVDLAAVHAEPQRPALPPPQPQLPAPKKEITYSDALARCTTPEEVDLLLRQYTQALGRLRDPKKRADQTERAQHAAGERVAALRRPKPPLFSGGEEGGRGELVTVPDESQDEVIQ